MANPDNIASFHDPLDSLERIIARFQNHGVIIGGIAASLLGQPRFTEDLDALLLITLDQIPEFLKIALDEGIMPRITDAEAFARKNRVLLLRHESSHTNIDISIGFLPFEVEIVQRRVTREIDDSLSINLPTPEDLIIMKAVAHRPKDLLDIQGIVHRHPDLDRERIQKWVKQFADLLDKPEIWEDISGWL